MSARLPIASVASVLHDPPTGPVQVQVGDLAKRSGKTVRALHLYEELGLLRPLGRSKGRYRLYGEDALVRIRWIAKLQDLGLSLHEIRALAQEVESVSVAPQVAARMRDIYEQKLQDTREQLSKLKELEAELETTLAYLHDCAELCAPARALHECRSCALRDDPHARSGCNGAEVAAIPDLVRGYQLSAAPSSPSLHGESPTPNGTAK